MLSRLRNVSMNDVSRKVNTILKRGPKTVPLPGNRGKPRILYFIAAYPTFSESYMHEEIDALSKDFDIRIITYTASERPRHEAFDYDLVEYGSPCLVYAPFPKVNLEFSDPEQIEFLQKVDDIIAEFQPDMLHAHYLGLGVLCAKLAEKHEIPFTLRSHSMDVLNEPDAKLDAYCERISASPWCRRVLAFPHSVERLTSHGMNPDLLVPCWPVINFEKFYRPEKHQQTNRVMCCGPAIKKKVHREFVDLAYQMRDTDYDFDLYAYGPMIWDTREYNKEKKFPVSIKYSDPTAMPRVYPKYDWLVYPSHQKINKVGLPCGVAEAMAAGIGVCWQELPGRRQEQLDFMGGAGFLFKSIDEVPAILAQPYPEEKRQAGFEAARRFDIQGHKHLLADVWAEARPVETA